MQQCFATILAAGFNGSNHFMHEPREVFAAVLGVVPILKQ